MSGEIVGGGGAEGWRAVLAGLVAGPVETAAMAGYEQECDGFDRAVPQRPAVVVGAAAEPDIAAAVRFGRDHGLGVGVLATGHGLTAAPIRGLGQMRVDHRFRHAHVRPGSTGKTYDSRRGMWSGDLIQRERDDMTAAGD